MDTGFAVNKVRRTIEARRHNALKLNRQMFQLQRKMVS